MLPITVVEESSLYYMYQIVQQLISFFKNITVLTSIFWNDFCVFFSPLFYLPSNTTFFLVIRYATFQAVKFSLSIIFENFLTLFLHWLTLSADSQSKPRDVHINLLINICDFYEQSKQLMVFSYIMLNFTAIKYCFAYFNIWNQ